MQRKGAATAKASADGWLKIRRRRRSPSKICQVKEVSKMRKGLIIPILIGISTEATADGDDVSISTKLCMIGAIENYSDAGTGLKSSDIERIRIECEAKAKDLNRTGASGGRRGGGGASPRQ
jgi:hypothetical protein